MADLDPPSGTTDDAGCMVFGCALAFWLTVPFPLWLLGIGFAGQLVLLPDNWDLLSIVWTITFYAPLALMAFVIVDNFRSQPKNDGED